MPHHCDILIIGGGPAGTTAAMLLAARGHQTVILEKDRHPRFHIGESLLPKNMEIFDRLGLRQAVAQIGVYKPGAEFVLDETGETIGFSFAHALGTEEGAAYQVVRADFDTMLFNAAKDRGAIAHENTRVTAVEQAGPNNRLLVIAEDAEGAPKHFAPRFVLDASGRDAFMATRLRSRRPNKQHNAAAIFAHFQGAEARTGEREGYITIHLVQDGWFWMIPLPGGVMSVGFVGAPAVFRARNGSREDFFAKLCEKSPTVRARMASAERISPVTAAGNYSYDAASSWGENYMMIGDAFAFIDPIFSSGVLLAMIAGERGAEVASAWLDNPARGRALARQAERDIRAGMRRIGWLIYRINQPALRHLFMSPSNHFRMRDGLISLLSGNLRADPRLRLPVLSFKAIYYLFAFLTRCGMDLSRLALPRAGA